MPDSASQHSQVSLMPGQASGRGPTTTPSYNHGHEHYHQQAFDSHPLYSQNEHPPTYPTPTHQQYNNNNYPRDPYPNHHHQHPQHQHHQQRSEDSVRVQQHRVARPHAEERTQDRKPPSYNHSYPPQPNSSSDSIDTKDPTLRSRLKKMFIFPTSPYGKALILVIAMEALLVIIMQVIIVAKYFEGLRDDDIAPASGILEDTLPAYLDFRNDSRVIPAYLIVFVFAQLFQLVMAWDAVRAQNTIEMIGIVIFNLCCFAYSVFEISQINTSLKDSGDFFTPVGKAAEVSVFVKPFLIVCVVVGGLSQCAVTWLTYQLFQEFGWKIYKKIGADPNMKKMYRAYQIYLVLIKVDLFFFLGFSIQFIYLTLTRRGGDPEYYLSIIVLPLTVVVLWVAVYAVRHESRKWMTTFIVAMLCGVAYFLFKVVRMYFGEKKKIYQGVRQFLTLFAALCLVTILVTIANAAVCFRNFGKGLKRHIMRDPREAQNSTMAPGGRVMEID